jgi:hypothetical protein
LLSAEIISTTKEIRDQKTKEKKIKRKERKELLFKKGAKYHT